MDKSKQKFLQEVKIQRLKLRKIINKFDPLGIGKGFPEDEYDNLISRIISILNNNKTNFIKINELLLMEFIPYIETNDGYLNIDYIQKNINKIIKWWSKYYKKSHQ